MHTLHVGMTGGAEILTCMCVAHKLLVLHMNNLQGLRWLQIAVAVGFRAMRLSKRAAGVRQAPALCYGIQGNHKLIIGVHKAWT